MSLPKLVDYDETSEESDSDESNNSGNICTTSDQSENEIESEESTKSNRVGYNEREETLLYRQIALSESDSSSSDESDDLESDFKVAGKSGGVLEAPKAKGELTIEDLPPIEDLYISVKQEESAVLGKIQSIVDQLVVVQSFPGICAVDIDSVLFLDEGRRALGKVFDIIGPVAQPLYCIRFNSKQHIEEKNILVGAMVYYAPKTEHTSYVFLPDLLNSKGSDASWKDDIEPPEKYLEYSDDEKERAARNIKKRLHEESSGSTSKATSKSQQRRANRNKNQSYIKNYNFPMHAPNFQPNSQPPFRHQSYNIRPNFVMNMAYPSFPNTGQQHVATSFQAALNNYQQAPIFNNPMMPTYMWYSSNLEQSSLNNQYNEFSSIAHPPPPPPPGT